MAQNDMHVVVFKILSYIYDCMKNAQKVDVEAIGHEALGIPEAYWTQIMRELCNRGYVTGIEVKFTTTRDYVHMPDPKITLDGVEFLMDNKMMSKAAKLVADAGGFFASSVAPFL